MWRDSGAVLGLLSIKCHGAMWSNVHAVIGIIGVDVPIIDKTPVTE